MLKLMHLIQKYWLVLNTEGATLNSYDFCFGDGPASIREKVLNNIRNLKTTETYG